MVGALGETAFNNRRLWTRLRAVKALYYRLFVRAPASVPALFFFSSVTVFRLP